MKSAAQITTSVALVAALLTGLPSGEYNFRIVKHEDGSITLTEADFGDPTDPPGEPPEPKPPEKPTDYLSALDEAEVNFGDDFEGFERTKTGLRLSLYVSPGMDLIQAHEQIQLWFRKELGEDWSKWDSWLKVYNGPLESGEVDDLEKLTRHVDKARKSLE